MKQGFKIFLLVPIFVSGGKIKEGYNFTMQLHFGKLLQLRGNYEEQLWFYTSGYVGLTLHTLFLLHEGETILRTAYAENSQPVKMRCTSRGGKLKKTGGDIK